MYVFNNSSQFVANADNKNTEILTTTRKKTTPKSKVCSYCRLTQSFLRLSLIFRASQSKPLNIKWSKSNQNHCSLKKATCLRNDVIDQRCFFSLGICACVPNSFSICVHLVFQLLPQLPCFRLPTLMHLVLPASACLCVCFE